MGDFDIFDRMNKLDEVKFQSLRDMSQGEFEQLTDNLVQSGTIRTTWVNLIHTFGAGLYLRDEELEKIQAEFPLLFEDDVIVVIEAEMPQDNLYKVQAEPRDWDVLSNDERGYTYVKWHLADQAQRDDRERSFEKKRKLEMGDFDIFEKLTKLNEEEPNLRYRDEETVDANNSVGNESVVNLVARVTSDGYLVAAEVASAYSGSDSYWADTYTDDFEEGDIETVELTDVPRDVAEQLVTMGTSEQEYSDGYEAWQAAQPYYAWTGKDNREDESSKIRTKLYNRKMIKEGCGKKKTKASFKKGAKKAAKEANDGDCWDGKDKDKIDKLDGEAMHMFDLEYDKLTRKQQSQVDDTIGEAKEQDTRLLGLRQDAHEKGLIVHEKGDSYVVTSGTTEKYHKEVVCDTFDEAEKAVKAWKVSEVKTKYEYKNVKPDEVKKWEAGGWKKGSTNNDKGTVQVYRGVEQKESKVNELGYQGPEDDSGTPDVSLLMQYENDELDDKGTIDLFAQLIKSGLAWKLQGSVYGRPAAKLIELGYIDKEGNVLRYPEEMIGGEDAYEDEDEYENETNEYSKIPKKEDNKLLFGLDKKDKKKSE